MQNVKFPATDVLEWEKARIRAASKIICMLRDEGFNTAQIMFTGELITKNAPHYSVISPDYSPKLEK